jgi:16S rRNA (guanine966-N2)-methyltransferase
MKLLSPKSDVSRPITDRVKESLFSILDKYDLPGGKIVADLFSGVGSLGLESLSRAAAFVTFVEKDPKVIAILGRNIEKSGFAGESKVIRADAFKVGAPVVLGTPYGDKQKYDLVFVDPPYSTTMKAKAGSPLSRLLDLLNGQLVAGGIVVVRTHKRTELSQRYGRLAILEQRQWGTMAVTILRQNSDDE